MEGNIYPMGDDMPHKLDEWTGCSFDLSELKNMLENNTFFEAIHEIVKYADTIPDDEAELDRYYNNYFSGKLCNNLKLEDIDENTPCGYYYFDKK